MLCNPTSHYPRKIDNMIFFQDNNLENVEIMNHYNNLITQEKYSEASIYINQQKCIYMGDDNTVNVHISNLRAKLGKVSPIEYIKTVWGIGFKMAEEAS